MFRREFSRKFGSSAKVALRRLEYIRAATDLRELAAVPGNRLEAAYDVEIVDYH